LPNGNTLINSGAQGVVFEVTAEKEVVWKFINPIKDVPPPGNSAPKPFQVIPKDARDFLAMKDEQRKKLDELDKELNVKLEAALNPQQRKVLNEPNDIDLSKVPAGEYLSALKREKLKLTDAQTEALQAIQAEFNPRITAVLNEEQKHKVEERKKAAPPARTGTPRKSGNTMFRVMRYAVNYPAFEGKTLKPGKTLIEIQEERDQGK
jgi:Spy/CpxP family protein refolding chaperone